jgi:hypothetical protein
MVLAVLVVLMIGLGFVYLMFRGGPGSPIVLPRVFPTFSTKPSPLIWSMLERMGVSPS